MHCHITNWILLTNTLRAIVMMHLIHYFMYFSKNKSQIVHISQKKCTIMINLCTCGFQLVQLVKSLMVE